MCNRIVFLILVLFSFLSILSAQDKNQKKSQSKGSTGVSERGEHRLGPGFSTLSQVLGQNPVTDPAVERGLRYAASSARSLHRRVVLDLVLDHRQGPLELDFCGSFFYCFAGIVHTLIIVRGYTTSMRQGSKNS